MINAEQRRKEIRELFIKLNTTNTQSHIFSGKELAKQYGVSTSVISSDIRRIKQTLHIPEPKYGIITTIHETVDGMDVEKTHIKYETSKGEFHHGYVKYFPNRRIATVVKLSPGETGEIDEVVHLGMNRKEVLKFFPRTSNVDEDKGYIK